MTRDHKGHKDLRVTRVLKEPMVLKAMTEHKVPMEQLVLKVPQDHKGHKVQQEIQVLKEMMEQLVLKETMVLKVMTALKVLTEP